MSDHDQEHPGIRGWPTPPIQFRPVVAESVPTADALDSLHFKVDHLTEMVEKLGPIPDVLLSTLMALLGAAALGWELVEEAARDSALAVPGSWHTKRQDLAHRMGPYLSPTIHPGARSEDIDTEGRWRWREP